MSNGSGEENRNGKALGSSAAVGKNGDPFGIEVVAVNDIPADVGPEEIGRITYYALFGFRTGDMVVRDTKTAINSAPLDFAAIEDAVDEAVVDVGVAAGAHFGDSVPLIGVTRGDYDSRVQWFGSAGERLYYVGDPGDVANKAMALIEALVLNRDPVKGVAIVDEMVKFHAWHCRKNSGQVHFK